MGNALKWVHRFLATFSIIIFLIETLERPWWSVGHGKVLYVLQCSFAHSSVKENAAL